MKSEDKNRYYENYKWFNQFFGDLRQLFISIHKMLANELSYKIGSRGWYYEKSNHQPSIPQYWVTGISESGFALQTFVVLDPSILEATPLFENELSLVFVKHAQSDKPLYITEFGLRVLKNSQITHMVEHKKYVSGEILQGDHSTPFHAFQVPLSAFTEGNNIQQTINDEVISVLREMPGWE